ncbi:MAG: hypothetical protein E7654_08180 [Ruminococcaceae bacterium]|nr:hypothetical protein [Oscillospiraceae bacterium]
MKLRFNEEKRSQPDPFIFEDNGIFYLYVTADPGVEAYTCDSLTGIWTYRGVVTAFADAHTFWAPSVIRLEDKYYMYVSCITAAGFQFMHVASADSPLGPFKNEKCLYPRFSIDSHMVRTEAGLFLWYAEDNTRCELKGTRVFVDRFIDPYTPEYDPKEVLLPEFEEEKYTPHCTPKGNWYTLEGPFWFKEGEWQYLMYSAGCYQDDTYHIGYAVAKSEEQDLKKVDFVKVTDHGKFAPLIIKNDFEEGTGHHSVIKHRGQYYAIYHGREYENSTAEGYVERRTARICRLTVGDGVITAERYESHL